MLAVANIDAAIIQQWIAAKLEPDAVEKELQLKGLSADEVMNYVKAFKKARNAKRFSAGMVYVAIGSILGFISTMLTIFNPFPELYYYILYGLTSVSVLVIFWGLYMIFE